jgi:hypothetical protein
MLPVRPLVAAAAAVLLASAATDAFAASSPQHVRGTVAAIHGSQLVVATSSGPVRLTIGPATRVGGVVPASRAVITAGTFIGSANVPDGANARALEVVVFPPALRGTGEGDYPWDLPAGGKHSSMTNGTVAMGGTAMSSMTNGNVVHAGTTGGVTVIHVTYKGGAKTIAIPPNAPIVRVVPATLAAVRPGARVFVIAKDGAVAGIVVGERGAVPPM